MTADMTKTQSSLCVAPPFYHSCLEIHSYEWMWRGIQRCRTTLSSYRFAFVLPGGTVEVRRGPIKIITNHSHFSTHSSHYNPPPPRVAKEFSSNRHAIWFHSPSPRSYHVRIIKHRTHSLTHSSPANTLSLIVITRMERRNSLPRGLVSHSSQCV